MKTLVSLLVLLSSLTSLAQSPVVTSTYSTRTVSAFFSCLNYKRGEIVVLSDKETEISSYVVSGATRTGYLMFVGGNMTGKGQTTGINYKAVGSEQYTYMNFNPVTGDGDFVITDNYYIYSRYPITNHIFHRTSHFTIANNGNNLTIYPDEVVCK